MRMREAVLTAMRDAMSDDPSVILLGEDVAEAGGVFKTSDGLLAEFGEERVRDTPISEMGFLGAAVGAALVGLRPIVEIMFVEFLGVALDQLVTQAAKMHYLSGGMLNLPLVVRATGGSGLGFAAQHSQMLETWFFGTPGLKVAVPSGPESAYGLLRAAVADNGPVVIIEPRALYGSSEEIEIGSIDIALGEARLRRTGSDITVVGLGSTTGVALEAANSAEAWDGEIVDLQTLVPWDKSTVLESVQKTGRLAIVEEGPYTGGWGTEIAAFVAAEAFRDLKAPVLRITAPDVPVPYPKSLEARYRPSATYAERQIRALVTTGELPPSWWGAAVSAS